MFFEIDCTGVSFCTRHKTMSLRYINTKIQVWSMFLLHLGLHLVSSTAPKWPSLCPSAVPSPPQSLPQHSARRNLDGIWSQAHRISRHIIYHTETLESLCIILYIRTYYTNMFCGPYGPYISSHCHPFQNSTKSPRSQQRYRATSALGVIFLGCLGCIAWRFAYHKTSTESWSLQFFSGRHRTFIYNTYM